MPDEFGRGVDSNTTAPFYDQMIGYLDKFGPVANSKTTFHSHDRLMGDLNEIGLRVNAKITLPSRDAGPVNSLWEKRGVRPAEDHQSLLLHQGRCQLTPRSPPTQPRQPSVGQ